LSVRHTSAAEGTAMLERAIAQVLEVLGEVVFSTDGRRLEEVVGELLASRRLWIAAAESCTGGLVTSRLTDVAAVPGTSARRSSPTPTKPNRAPGVPPAFWPSTAP
jgi:nicotinamide-nucleotide amidase